MLVMPLVVFARPRGIDIGMYSFWGGNLVEDGCRGRGRLLVLNEEVGVLYPDSLGAWYGVSEI